MNLIGDIGGSTAEWRLTSKKGESMPVRTKGFHPLLDEPGKLQKVLLDSDIWKYKKKINSINYYGTSCALRSSKIMVSQTLSGMFPDAKITVESDLLGAARALCGRREGIACILGTGSSSCLFNGKKIQDQVPSLGYMLGDEGSGAHMGKRLVRKYFYRELPEKINQALEIKYQMDRNNVLDRLYERSNPNKYLADFAPFIAKHKRNKEIKRLIKYSLVAFIRKHLIKYKNADTLPIHFSGSVAYYFQDILKDSLLDYDLNMGRVIRKPIDELLNFHINS